MLQKGIYLFHTTKSHFCGGAFAEKEIAEKWIFKYKLSGILTLYPVNISTYDWAIETDNFTVKKDAHKEPNFIGGFSSASQKHFHYENGVCLDTSD